MAVSLICFSCQKEMTFSDAKIGFREECASCRADVHVCKNCEFYDAKAYNECHEPAADRVTEKERANRCEFFTLRKGGIGKKDSAAALKAAADALFKKS